MYEGFPGSSVVKNPPDNAGDSRDAGSVLGSGRSLGGGNSNPFQYPSLENAMDRGTWQAAVHGVTKSWKWLSITHIYVCETENRSVVSESLRPNRLYSPWNSLGQNAGVGNHSLLQGIFPIQGSNPGLPHCRWILYQLSHEGSPRILEWVAYSFCRGSSQPTNRTGISCIAGGFFTSWATRESPHMCIYVCTHAHTHTI